MANRENLLKSKESINLAKDILNTLLNAETSNRGFMNTTEEKLHFWIRNILSGIS